ncbi:MAG: dUTP diphosphatase [Vicinamibacterales bacterium]
MGAGEPARGRPPAAGYYSPLRLSIKRHDPTVPLPLPATGGAAAFDQAASETVDVPPHAIRLVGTGLVIGVPPGHFLAIFARSSTPLKRGLMVANGVGVVDADYCGPTDEVKVQVINVTDEVVTVARGDRIAQGIVLPAPAIEWDEVDEIQAPSRGGFGSTGAR